MTPIKCKEACILCGQPVEIKGFELNSTDGLLRFCCAGCLSIYQLLNNEKIITKHNPTLKNEDI